MTAALGSLALLHLLMPLVPGPNTLLVMRLAASRSRAAGLGLDLLAGGIMLVLGRRLGWGLARPC